MKSIVLVVLIALLAVTVQNVHAQACSDGECISTVLVTQYFYTADCSGNGTLSTNTNYTEACSTSDYGSYNRTVVRTCTPSRFTTLLTPDTTSCSRSSHTTTYNSAIGVCRRTGASTSEITWCNQASISNKFKVAKSYTNETAAPHVSAPCNITTGCTNNTGTVRYYSGATCSLGNATLALPASTIQVEYLGLLLDTCYTSAPIEMKRDVMNGRASLDLDGSFNVLATCKNGQYSVIYSTGGCGASATFLEGASYPTDTCLRYNDGSMSISCPTSASSTLVTGPLAFAILLIAFLLF